MKRIVLKVIAVIWLLIVMPLFGLFPLLCLFPSSLSKPAYHIEMALIGEVLGMFMADPYPELTDVWPSMTSLQLGIMSFIILAISAGAISLLVAKRTSKQTS